MAQYNLQEVVKNVWVVLAKYLCQGGCYDGGVGISWLHARLRPGSCFVPYVVAPLQNDRAGHAYSKHHLRVNSGISSFNLAIDCPNKKIMIRRIWRIGGIRLSVKIMKTIELSLILIVPSSKQY